MSEPSASADAGQTQPSTANDPGPSGGDVPAKAEHFSTKERSEREKEKEKAEWTRPEIPKVFDLVDMYWKREEVYTQEEKSEAWSSAAKMVETYSDDMIKRWKEEIDAYLVFAGLFSAVLTTFNVQSYLLLQPAAPDPSIAVLHQISSQLASFSISPSFLNSTQPSSTARANANTPPPVPPWAVWLNSLWFSALILSLTSASVGIMVKQWLNEYSSGLSGNSRPVARVRQQRLENLEKWRVEGIVATIPVLLQLALAFFLGGLLILLWTLHHSVAICASTLVGLLAVFTVCTTFIPLFDHGCSYLTPQLRVFHSLWRPDCVIHRVRTALNSFIRFWNNILKNARKNVHRRSISAVLQTFVASGLRQPRDTYVHLTNTIMGVPSRLCNTLRRILADLETKPRPTWQGQELSAVSMSRARSVLDKNILLTAYSTTLNHAALAAATVCLTDRGCDAAFALDYFRRLHACARAHFGAAADSGDGPLGQGNQQKLLWLDVMLCVLWTEDAPPSLSDEEAAALGVYFECGVWATGMRAADAEWAVSTCDAITDYLEGTGTAEARFIDPERLRAERGYLVDHAARREAPLRNVFLPAVTWKYRQVRLKQSRLAEVFPDDTKVAHTSYLESVDYFLVCANHAVTSSIPANDLETIRAYTRDVLTELTRTLLEVFADNKPGQTVHAPALQAVLWTLAKTVSEGVLECIPDDGLLDVARMTDALAQPHDYDGDNTNHWGWGIQLFARQLGARVVRVKETSTQQILVAGSLRTEAIAPAGVVVTSASGAVESPSVGVLNTGDDSQVDSSALR